MKIADGLAQLKALKNAWWDQAGSVIKQDPNYEEGKLYRIREQIHAVQFQLLLHTPCRQFDQLERSFW